MHRDLCCCHDVTMFLIINVSILLYILLYYKNKLLFLYIFIYFYIFLYIFLYFFIYFQKHNANKKIEKILSGTATIRSDFY
jgi:hypothetical protein